jgi:peroxidase family protein
MIHRHNVIEHDASISRRDAFFDPSNKFDEATFSNFLSYLGDDPAPGVVAVENARARHTFDMSKLNPEFGLTKGQVGVIQGEVATMLGIFGNPEAPFVNRTWFEFFISTYLLPCSCPHHLLGTLTYAARERASAYSPWLDSASG